MIYKKKLKYLLILFVTFAVLYFYYYIPKQNIGSIKIEKGQEIESIKDIKFKNTLKNTEYISADKEGKIFTTQAEESTVYQNNPDNIFLKKVYSFTKLKKDNSLLEIRSLDAEFDQKKNETIYENNVVISNKSYLINSKIAKHIAKNNLIIIENDVVMKDFSNGLVHIIYCDIVEINTVSNKTIAYMKSKIKKVIVKKFK
jgi:hypothetical protein